MANDKQGSAGAKQRKASFLEPKEIKRLIGILSAAGAVELELEEGSTRLRIRMPEAGQKTEFVQVANPFPGGSFPSGPYAGGGASPDAPAESGGEAEAAAAVPDGAVHVTSPLVGTFYRAPSPDSEPFAKTGDRVDADATLCIIEAMKVMNEIQAEQSCEILEVLVENGEPVEFGQPMFLVKPL